MNVFLAPRKDFRQKRLWLALALWIGSLLSLGQMSAQPAVQVFTQLDSPEISVGEETILRVFAQVRPELRSRALQIFSWHIDLSQEFPNAAEILWGKTSSPSSDSDPATSSMGIQEGSLRRGLYDTLIGTDLAGVSTRVELLRASIKALKEGESSFQIRPGTGPEELAADFLVLGINPTEEWSGGDYSSATATLRISGLAAQFPKLRISLSSNPAGDQLIQLAFDPIEGRRFSVEASDRLGDGANWVALPNSPHAGSATETRPATQTATRFYRLMEITQP